MAKKKYEVIDVFRDKDTDEAYKAGDEFTPKNQERADYLAAHGYIKEVQEETKDTKKKE